MSANFSEGANDSPFIAGIKSVIKSNFSSQADFAEGVTSKVNLSNVLRGHSGTSEKMRKKLSEKAGMTVDEVIALGKAALNPANISRDTFTHIDPAADVTELSSSELLDKVNNLNLGITDNILSHTRATHSLISSLIAERDKLIKLLHREQAVMNAIEARVKVVGKDLRILTCNRQETEATQQVTGDLCREEDCQMCGSGDCLAKKVFSSGKVLRSVYMTDAGQWETRVAYPSFAESGEVLRVVIVTRDITEIAEWFKEAGFSRPSEPKIF